MNFIISYLFVSLAIGRSQVLAKNESVQACKPDFKNCRKDGQCCSEYCEIAEGDKKGKCKDETPSCKKDWKNCKKDVQCCSELCEIAEGEKKGKCKTPCKNDSKNCKKDGQCCSNYCEKAEGEKKGKCQDSLGTPPTKFPTKTTDEPTKPPVDTPTAPTFNPPPATAPTPVTEEIIENAKEDILALTENNDPLKAKFLRLGFHDCVGGCDGCVDLQEPDNNGLEIPIVALEPVVTTYSASLSRADIWALATIVGAESSQRNRDSIDFIFDFTGRVDCENAGVDVCVNVAGGCDPSRNGPIRALPSSNLNTAEVLHFFNNEFGFGAEETVALMGAHTIGEAIPQHSGFDGQWVRDNVHLDNRYYTAMIGDDGSVEDWFNAPGWTQQTITNNDPNIPNRIQWRRGGANNNQDGDIMLNTDIALVRDFDGLIDTTDGSVSCEFRNRNPCPAAHATIAYMAKFKFSNSEWLSAFRDVLNKMVKNGYSDSAKEHSKPNIFD